MRELFLISIFASAVLWGMLASIAKADPADLERARVSHLAGLEALADGQLEEAEAEFRQALSIQPRASSALNLALVLHEQGRFRESLELYARLVEGEFGELPVSAEELDRYRSATLKEQPRVEIRAAGAARMSVWIDGESVGTVDGARVLSVNLDVGEHVAQARADRRASPNREFTLRRSERRELYLEIPPATADRATETRSVDLGLTTPAAARSPAPPRVDDSGPSWWLIGGAGVAAAVTAVVVAVALSSGGSGSGSGRPPAGTDPPGGGGGGGGDDDPMPGPSPAGGPDPFEEGPIPRVIALR